MHALRESVFAALAAVLGLTPAINVPGISVPITAQTLGVMIAGLMLVPIEAFLSVALFVGLVATGLPLLSGGRGGLSVFTGPSADRKSTRLNSSHLPTSRMPSSA